MLSPVYPGNKTKREYIQGTTTDLTAFLSCQYGGAEVPVQIIPVASTTCPEM